jgi:hypothetical protein
MIVFRKSTGDSLGNTIGPAISGAIGIGILFLVMGIIVPVTKWLVLPQKAFLGLRVPVLRRVLVRLISNYGQEFINKLAV